MGTKLICAAFALLLLAMCGVLLLQASRRRQAEWEDVLAETYRCRYHYQSAICAISLGQPRAARRLLRREWDMTPSQLRQTLKALTWLYNQGQLAGWQLSLAEIDSLDGYAFESFCARLLQELGFREVEQIGASGDQGADILGLYQGQRWAIQCKHYTWPLGNAAVQQAASGRAYWDCQQAAVLTNSTFTPAAIAAAQANQVLLWDRDKLQELMGLCEDK